MDLIGDDDTGRAHRWRFGLIAAIILLAFFASTLTAQENEDCLMCHEDPDLEGQRGDFVVSVFVDPEAFAASVHADFGCIDCHGDLDGTELPHEDDLEAVDCTMCHDDVGEELEIGPQGAWAKDPLSPSASCINCHGTHDVLAASDPAAMVSASKSNELCGRCHAREIRDVERSPHARKADNGPAASCVSCHAGHQMEPPQGEQEEVAICGTCHEQQAVEHGRSFHGRAAARGDELAPSCVTCHKHHAILPSSNLASPTSNMNVPILCGRCHHEGTQVSLTHDIPQDRILENYSQSIHGVGLFKKGLTVTAVCTSCHTSHDILEHTDPRSSIHRENVADTCMVCHARIEEVHVKVVEGRLWEEKPHQIPSCVECHQPHKIRREPLTALGAANRNCLRCHSDPELAMERHGVTVSLDVDETAYNISSHAGVACAQCHVEVTPSRERACETIVSPVDCSTCHAAVVQNYRASIHGVLAAEGDRDAPVCLDCHGKHDTEDDALPSSPTYPRNVPELCAKCHRHGEVAATRIESDIPDIVESYVMSIHGKGLLDSGLVVSASCTDCHTAHLELPAADPMSTVNSGNVATTCGECHHGIEETFRTSVHWPENTDTESALPTCESCHTSHTISRTDASGFRLAMMNQCGRCHADEAHTFFDTYHGKVSRLGSEGAAKCYDCHGTHNILPPENPDSMLSRDNVVDTCATCHPGAHRQFAGYLTHATHHDPEKYPFLFYSFWFMTSLLVGTMTFAFLHTGAWLWRLIRTRDKWVQHKKAPMERMYERFSRAHRLMHLVMLVSFFTLALTGMALKFSYMGWATVLSRMLGGFAAMGLLHRVAAVALLLLFAYHLRQIWKGRKASGKGWLAYIFDKNSLMFNLTDIRQIWQSIKWFFGRGPRPHYGRFTYWEKFDYFAVFWGVFVIGSTGLVLWFPEFFTRFIPGWSVNVATIIHSDEALLAVAFIFTIHFFNTHFRPDKFPMDPVIFTGRVPVEELRHDKPDEYDDLMASGTIAEIEARLLDAYPRRLEKAFKTFGFIALGTGLTLIALIVYSMLFGYR
jgi:cytochrome b subunit of formate dehydrogenase